MLYGSYRNWTNRDLHSDSGGTVANPINSLCEMIASLHDEEYRVTIPGFYDKVRTYTEEERKDIERAPIDDTAFKTALNLRDLRGKRIPP